MDMLCGMDTRPQRTQAAGAFPAEVAPGCDTPTAAQVERCQERLTSLTTSFAYAAPEVGHRFQAEASECLNTIARHFGLVDSQNADTATRNGVTRGYVITDAYNDSIALTHQDAWTVVGTFEAGPTTADTECPNWTLRWGKSGNLQVILEHGVVLVTEAHVVELRRQLEADGQVAA